MTSDSRRLKDLLWKEREALREENAALKAKLAAQPHPPEPIVQVARRYLISHQIATSGNCLELAKVIQAAIDEQANAWKVEAARFDREVAEFGHPISPDHDHHPVRDYLIEAWSAGAKSVEGDKMVAARHYQAMLDKERDLVNDLRADLRAVKAKLDTRDEQAKPLVEALRELLDWSKAEYQSNPLIDERARKALEDYEKGR